MKLGCSSRSYDAAFRQDRIGLREFVRVCGEELELDGVELLDEHFPTIDPQYLRDLKRLCVEQHLTVAGLAVTNDFGPEDRREREIARVRQWVDVAVDLGAPVVRIFAGWRPAAPAEREPGRVVGFLRRVFGQKPPDRRRLWSDVTWALRQCADYAAERGIVLAVQNNRIDGIVGSSHELTQCVNDVGSPWLCVCLDPADLADRIGVEDALPRTVQAHARLSDIREDGSDAGIHWPEIARTLRQGRYRGFLLLDYDGVESPIDAVPRAVRYMRGVLHLLERQHLLTPPADAAGDAPDDPAIEAVAPERDVDAIPPELSGKTDVLDEAEAIAGKASSATA